MRYRLDLVLKPAEGALTRVIGMAERRGFTPHSINGGSALRRRASRGAAGKSRPGWGRGESERLEAP